MRSPLALVVCLFNVVFLALAAIPMMILHETLLRGRCHHCGRLGLRGGRILGDATLHPGDSRDFFSSECDYCRHQFHTFDDRSVIHIAPQDPRYETGM